MHTLTKILLTFSLFLSASLFSMAFADIIISDNRTLQLLNNNPEKLRNYINEHQHVHLKTRNGAWTKKIALPNNVEEGKKVTLIVNSAWSVTLNNGSIDVVVKKGSNASWIYQNGLWIQQSLDTSKIIIDNKITLRSLQNNANELKKYIDIYDEVHLKTRNGAWTKNIILPSGVIEGKKVTLTVNSAWKVIVNDGNINFFIDKGSIVSWVYTNGFWVTHDIDTSYRLIADNPTLGSLQNNANELKKYIDIYDEVHLKTYNGAWTANIILPSGVTEGKKLILEVESSWSVNLNDGIQTHNLKKGDKTSWTFTQGAWIANNPTTNIQVYYYHNDHLGTPKALTNKDQTIVWQANHSPFGAANITTEQIINNIRFPGQYFDRETNLHYNYQRYYNTNTGRYITSDPIGLEGGINTYGYVGGNPVNFVDPDGLSRSSRRAENSRPKGRNLQGVIGSWVNGRFYPKFGAPKISHRQIKEPIDALANLLDQEKCNLIPALCLRLPSYLPPYKNNKNSCSSLTSYNN